MAQMLYQSLQPSMDEDSHIGDGAVGLNSADDTLPYSTSELNAPEYSTDEFRMFQFKVARCSKRYVHDWRACPFAHPTENARRRDPRLVKYLPVPCPDYKRGICLRGDACPYSHGVYECWLHPAKYRTQLCKEGPSCRRPVCFFAHSVLDLRQPTHLWSGAVAEDPAAAPAGGPTSAAAALLQAMDGGAVVRAPVLAPRLSVDSAAPPRLASEELLNNMQAVVAGRPSADSVLHPSHPRRGMPSHLRGGMGMGLGGAPLMSATAAGSGGWPSLPEECEAPMPLQPRQQHQQQHERKLLSSSSAAIHMEQLQSGGSGGSPQRRSSPPTPVQLSTLSDSPLHLAPAAAAAAAEAAPLPPDVAAATAAAVAAAAAAATAAQQHQQRMSLDSRLAAEGALAGLGASAAAAPVLPPRMSVDSALQGSAGSTPAAGGSPWGPAPVGTTAAAALAGLPLNEQPFPPSTTPRMSNAVARKLGLAPQRSSLDPRLTKLQRPPSGAATPPRSSVDGLMGAAGMGGAAGRPSFEQQQHHHMLSAGVNHQMLAAGLAGLSLNKQGMMGGGYVPAYAAPGAHFHAGAMGLPPHEALINPALLSLVAANVGSPVHGLMHAPGAGMAPHPGADDPASVAHLLASMGGVGGPDWALGGGRASMGHHPHQRLSMEAMHGCMSGMQAPPMAAGLYLPHDVSGIWSSSDRLNNQAGTSAEA